jgi:hypothetical protein
MGRSDQKNGFAVLVEDDDILGITLLGKGIL